MTIEQNQPEQPAIPNYLIWSILATFLFIPIGIYPLILSCKIDSLVAQNRGEEARQTSVKTKKWIFISFGVVIGIYILLFLIFLGLMFACGQVGELRSRS